METLNRHCSEVIFDKFLILGPFLDSTLISTEPGITMRDWEELEN